MPGADPVQQVLPRGHERVGSLALQFAGQGRRVMSVGTRSAATGQIVETFIGTAAGLVAGFVLTSPRVQPAEEAIEGGRP